MPLYTSATTAAALELPPKWLDNLLSHNKIDGVSSECQGVARRLSLAAVETVAVVRELSTGLSIPVAVAIRIADRLLREPGRIYPASGIVRLSIDVEALRRDVAMRLAHAVEIAPHRPRGRPRKTWP